MTIRTRFSPSPTGMIHIGNARAALFSALYAKKNNGHFILRIEDTDLARSDEQFVESLIEDLHWLGIYWQEGPGQEGEYGPYWQSQRQAIYAKYYKILEEKGLVYPCFCTDQELMLARKLALSKGHAPRYSGKCRQLSSDEIKQRMDEGKKPAWRFSVPVHSPIKFVDVVKGEQVFQSDDIGDFIIRRADGTAPFLFCNAMDDAEMKVSHVLRGEDHLANTPRQLMLLRALNLHEPQYGHLSLIVGEDGAPLSKRHGSFSVSQFKDQGFLPVAIMNYLARLGHTSDDIQHLLSFDNLAPHFHLDKLSKSPARFDVSQLMFWQKMAVAALDNAALWRWMGEHVRTMVPENAHDLFAESVKANIEFPHDATHWANIFFHDQVSLDETAKNAIREAGEQFFVEAELSVDKYGIDLSKVLDEMKNTLSLSGKKLFIPLRMALTGQAHGPELIKIVQLLGLKKVKHRLSQAFKLASA